MDIDQKEACAIWHNIRVDEQACRNDPWPSMQIKPIQTPEGYVGAVAIRKINDANKRRSVTECRAYISRTEDDRFVYESGKWGRETAITNHMNKALKQLCEIVKLRNTTKGTKE